MHSDYLKYVNERINIDTKSTIEEKLDLERLEVLTEDYINTSSKFTTLSFTEKESIIAGCFVQFNETISTKSGHSNEVQLLAEELINEINNSITTISDEPSTIILNILMTPKYTSCSDENFQILAATAATYLDSYKYWKSNLSKWTMEINTKSWDWNRFWGYVKQFSVADAEAACQSAIVAVFTGPLALEVLFVSAGVGSAWECYETIAAM